jgi:hypothetical protein
MTPMAELHCVPQHDATFLSSGGPAAGHTPQAHIESHW